MKSDTIAFAFLVIFGLFGSLLIGTSIHEYIHYNDMKNLQTSGEICLFNIPTNLSSYDRFGYYTWTYNKSDEYEVVETTKMSESKSYTLTYLTILLYVVSVLIVFFKRTDSHFKLLGVEEKIK